VPNVYIIGKTGTTEAMDRIRCKDEKQELQDILNHNHDLLPGDQIDPEDPCRWMLVKREMPVPDPATGNDRWNVDFFFVDQTATPTFVECKRFADTRSRREVVGQVLEYVANGQHYWSKDLLRKFAEDTAKLQRSTIEERFSLLKPSDFDSVDVFFDRVEANLKEAQVRIIFFLEEAPNELKCLVEFLNKQMVSSDVLLVEVSQYTRDGIRVVVPMLFGFTEQARRVKQTVTVTQREARKWDWETFKNDAQKKGLNDADIDAIRKLREVCESIAAEIHWGGGKLTGSFSAKWQGLCSGAVLSVYSNGELAVGFGNLGTTEAARFVRGKLKDALVQRLGLRVPENLEKKYPQYSISEWGPRVDELIVSLAQIIPQIPGSQS